MKRESHTTRLLGGRNDDPFEIVCDQQERSKTFFLLLAIVIIGGVSLLWRPPLVSADGVILVPKRLIEAEPSQNAQQAVIVWNNGIETLHLQSNYNGPMSDFCWIIPVPSRPRVERSSWQLFQEAEEVTRPQLMSFQSKFGLGCGCGRAFNTRYSVSLEENVVHLESLKIRELHLDILAAHEGQGLVQWLHLNGYAIPGKAEPILQEYTEKQFFFIVVKIQEGNSWPPLKEVHQTVTTGLTPLAITFKTERPFYPLKISRITSESENELILFLISPHRVQPIQYTSGALTGTDIEIGIIEPALSTGEKPIRQNFEPAIKEAQKRIGKRTLVIETAINISLKTIQTENAPWITRFHAFLTPDEMEDITFTPAEKDEPLPKTFYIHERIHRAASLPLSCMLAGISLMFITQNRPQHLRLRQIAIVLLLCAFCMM